MMNVKFAKDFKLMDQNEKTHSLSDYKGKLVLLYFYPKDMTPGCTIEAKKFRDNIGKLEAHGVQVLGVSPDSVEMHKEFAEKHDLNFPILADVDKKVINQFGVWVEKSMFGKKYMGVQRDSFLIGKDFEILRHYTKVNPLKHIVEVLKDLSKLT
jgi:peroxiredoxin Q/BCP